MVAHGCNFGINPSQPYSLPSPSPPFTLLSHLPDLPLFFSPRPSPPCFSTSPPSPSFESTPPDFVAWLHRLLSLTSIISNAPHLSSPTSPLLRRRIGSLFSLALFILFRLRPRDSSLSLCSFPLVGGLYSVLFCFPVELHCQDISSLL
ncbi:hypothetical protein RND81_01G106500 [Saponaria officinalis]|uniref:Uncharacterized protein n=1 Tax=Saponaria officinalis TaxID=3572 RepID=A0AAW1NDL0_SAPOF